MPCGKCVKKPGQVAACRLVSDPWRLAQPITSVASQSRDQNRRPCLSNSKRWNDVNLMNERDIVTEKTSVIVKNRLNVTRNWIKKLRWVCGQSLGSFDTWIVEFAGGFVCVQVRGLLAFVHRFVVPTLCKIENLLFTFAQKLIFPLILTVMNCHTQFSVWCKCQTYKLP